MSAALARLLASGGDERLTLDPRTGRNIYGYGVEPQPGDIAMGSSTASTISARAHAAALRHLAQIERDVARHGEAAVYDVEVEAIRARIHVAIGTDGAREAPDIVITPSGTDIHLLVALLLAPARRPLVTITLVGSETGSGVGTAASGCHFMRHLPSGASAMPDTPLALRHRNVPLAVRDGGGALRDAAEVEADIDDAIAAAVADDAEVLLIVGDVTKTGLIAPALDSVLRLQARHGDRLAIMIDACQLRVSPATIRAYLARDWLVAITGSKFLGGPVFSGALLCPPGLGQLAARRLPPGIADYLAAADVPAGWALRACLPERANFGLALRWSASLTEWERLLACPPETVDGVMRAFARAVERRLREDPAFARLATRPLDRRCLDRATPRPPGHDDIPTIFAFLLRVPDPVRGTADGLDATETRQVYDMLAAGGPDAAPVRLGQPVACGTRAGVAISALRLCLGAGAIADACAGIAAQDRLIDQAMQALDLAARAAQAVRRPRRLALAVG